MEKFKEYSRQIENSIARQDFDHDPAELYEPVTYILALGGKRLRPALCLAGCDLYSGSLDDAMRPALGLELFHNFSLIHDDIMDDAHLRRGKKTVHNKWNTNQAILTGDAMLVKAYQYVASVSRDILPAVLSCFSETAIQLCEGQQYDMNFEKDNEVDEEGYLEMIRLKTAVLLGASLKIGALIGNTSLRDANALYHFGVNAGMAFQVQDDYLDAFGDTDKVGKKAGGDILQDKKTLLMIYTRQLDSAGWQELRKQDLQGEERVKAYKKLFRASGAVDKVLKKRDDLLEEGMHHLDSCKINNPEVKDDLKQFAGWLAKRKH